MGAHIDGVPVHPCCLVHRGGPHSSICPERFSDGSYKPSPILRYFAFKHLPDRQASFSELFCVLAEQLDATLPGGPEKTVALRKLLEAKDAAVRSSLDLEDTPHNS